jgi:CHAT domain-containing protein/tetratricopeptide (TPR) repeat protein
LISVLLALATTAAGLATIGPAFSPAADQREQLQQAIRYGTQANQLRRDGKLTEAIALWKKRVAILREVLGDDNEYVTKDLDVLARWQVQAEDFAGARTTRQLLVDIQTRRKGAGHWETTDARLDLAEVEQLARLTPEERRQLADADRLADQAFRAFRQRKLDEAVRLERQSLAVRKQVTGEESRDYASSLSHLVIHQMARDDPEAARPDAEQAVAMRRKLLGEQHPNTARSLDTLGLVLNRLGRTGDARADYEQALPVFEKTLGPRHPETVSCLGSLGTLLLAAGNYTAARPYLERRLGIDEKLHGPDHAETTADRERLGVLLASLGDYPAARAQFERALAARRAQAPDSAETADALIDLGLMLHGMEDYLAAQGYFAEALPILRRARGENHPDTAGCLQLLGAALGAQGDYPAARRLLEQALEVYQKSPATRPSERYALAVPLGSLGMLLLRAGDYRSARPYLEQAFERTREVFGDEHPATARARVTLALLDGAEGRWDGAGGAMDRAHRSFRRLGRQTLAGLLEPEQLTFLRTNHDPALHQALSLALARPGDERMAKLSAGWVLNGKGVAQEVLAERPLLARASRDSHVAESAHELLAVRTRLAALTVDPPPGEAGRRQRDDLAARERELARQVAQAAGRPERPDPWVGLDDVRRALPADAVLIEVARFHAWDFRAKAPAPAWQAPRYAAWVIPPEAQGTPRVIDLGDADAIDDAVWAARQVMETPPRPGVSASVPEPLTALAEKVLQPILDHVGRARRWLISPDGDLWLVPWGALPLPGDREGRYAVEKYTISYVVSGRDLAGPAPPAAAQPPLLMADPDYDLDPEAATAETRRILADRSAPSRGERRSGALGRRQWPRLPGTAKEAEAIKPALGRYAGEPPAEYLQERALEGVFKAADRPRAVVLSTHGYFLEDQADASPPLAARREARGLELLDPPAPRPRRRQPGAPQENPLLRCGLVLAGANHRDRAGASGDDGILTGLEIVGTDLRGTDLVVLSACETGVGRVHAGEGVAGLRQAFQLAGARAVVATLWSIPDRETAALMGNFFDGLARGRAKADALREAQRSAIRGLRTRGEPPHPYTWAAFTLTGQ